MDLQINFNFPRHQVYYEWPQVAIDQRFPQVMLDYDGPRVTIDQKASMAEMGLGDYRHFAKEVALKGREELLAGISRLAQEGDRLAREISRSTISEIVQQRRESQMPQINVAAVPQTPPQIECQYDVAVNFEPGYVAVKIRTFPPRIEWLLGDIQVKYVKGENIDIKG